jgi:hypothetical protein
MPSFRPFTNLYLLEIWPVSYFSIRSYVSSEEDGALWSQAQSNEANAAKDSVFAME